MDTHRQGKPLNRALVTLIVGLTACLATAISGVTAANAGGFDVDGVTAYSWDGPDSGSRLGNAGRLNNIGDLNGDGVDDFVTTSKGGVQSGFVLFGPVGRMNEVDLNDLPPTDGYRISGNFTSISAIGDHNGDGVNDFYVDGGLLRGMHIVYAVADPSSLDECDPGVSRTRCVDFMAPVDGDGNRLGLRLQRGNERFNNKATNGDFTGTGEIQSLLFRHQDSQVTVLRGDLDALCESESGACTLQVDSIPTENRIVFQGAPGTSFGANSGTISPGDINGDGRDDIVANSTSDGSDPEFIRVIFGQDWTESPVDVTDLDNSLGYTITLPFGVLSSLGSIGDVNGDGLADFFVGDFTLLPEMAAKNHVIFGQRGDVGADWNFSEFGPAKGYTLLADPESQGYLDTPQSSPLGDLNGDGIGDFLVGYENADYGSAGAGAAWVVFGTNAERPDSQVLNAEENPDLYLLITDESGASGAQFAHGLAAAGDFDDDGLPDFAATRSGDGSPNGQVLLIAGKKLIAQASTGAAGPIGRDGTGLNGSVKPNGRAGKAWFEFGKTDGYGSRTDQATIERSNRMVSTEGAATGLEPGTTYHYRLVVENDKGVKAFGKDRTFTTTDPDRCVVTPDGPGCQGETGKQFCERNPSDAVCQGKTGPQAPRLSKLIVSPKTIKVKRGKKGKVTVTVVNTGNATAKGVRICASGPKKFVKVPKCKRVGALKAGAVASRAFKLKVKKRARKGKKLVLKLKAHANGLGSKSARANVRVR